MNSVTVSSILQSYNHTDPTYTKLEWHHLFKSSESASGPAFDQINSPQKSGIDTDTTGFTK